MVDKNYRRVHKSTAFTASHKNGNNVFSKLKEDKPDLVGVGCPAHIINNCIYYGQIN